ncbi:hypothetical protein H9P43_001709 [Blastocladiella emersonii ATCC 22665]|nr:hypothetical protein H9P43_001709 [Blastocladiella emersonii ATCC 22665]
MYRTLCSRRTAAAASGSLASPSPLAPPALARAASTRARDRAKLANKLSPRRDHAAAKGKGKQQREAASSSSSPIPAAVGIGMVGGAAAALPSFGMGGAAVDPWAAGFEVSSASKSHKAAKQQSSNRMEWVTISGTDFKYDMVKPPAEVRVAELRHGLDRVLFNPGVHFLQDPRSGVYNFDPYLQRIAHPDDVNFDTFPPYITASKDPQLRAMAKREGCSFVSSTSSISGAMSQMYFMMTGGKPLDISKLSHDFISQSTAFTRIMRSPTSVVLTRQENGVYSVDADKSYDKRETILTRLGKSMERMLTTTRDEFASQHLIKNVGAAKPAQSSVPEEAYAYGRAGGMLLRAQLDCYDPRLPRKTFDLKTRATLAVRMNADNVDDNVLYHIKYAHGLFASYEREYYDMIRAAFLKYSLQVRIGHMDGIMVAFHNTARIFGFQYISLEEMDSSLFGGSAFADQTFALSAQLLEAILRRAVDTHPDARVLRVTFDTERGENAVYVEEVPGGNADDMHLDRLNPRNASKFNPPPMSRFRVYSAGSVNGEPLADDTAHPRYLNPTDEWKLRYAITTEGASDHLAFDYFKLRRAQDEARRSRPEPVPGADDRNKSGSLMAKVRRHFVSEDEAALDAEATKVMYKSRFPVAVPMTKRGEVKDAGWDL